MLYAKVIWIYWKKEDDMEVMSIEKICGNK